MVATLPAGGDGLELSGVGTRLPKWGAQRSEGGGLGDAEGFGHHRLQPFESDTVVQVHLPDRRHV